MDLSVELAQPQQDLLSSAISGLNMNPLNYQAWYWGISGRNHRLFRVIKVGAFLMQPPAWRILSTRNGLKGTNLLLQGRLSFLLYWRHDDASENYLSCTQCTMLLSASNWSETHNPMVLDSCSVEVLDETCWKPIALLENRTRFESEYHLCLSSDLLYISQGSWPHGYPLRQDKN